MAIEQDFDLAWLVQSECHAQWQFEVKCEVLALVQVRVKLAPVMCSINTVCR